MVDSGFIDIGGYAPGLRGWLFWGWVGLRDPNEGGEAIEFTIVFEEGEVTGVAKAAFFPRGDLAERGVGMIVFAECQTSPGWRLRDLRLTIGGAAYPSHAGQATERLEASALIRRLTPLAEDQLVRGRGREPFLALLAQAYRDPAVPKAAPRAPAPEPGFVDLHGFAASLPGWLFWGWIRGRDLAAREVEADFNAVFDEGRVSGRATVALFERPDLKGIGVGVCVMAECAAAPEWRLRHFSLTIEGLAFRAQVGGQSRRLDSLPLIEALSPLILERVAPGKGLETFARRLSRVYRGADTLDSLSGLIRLEVDAAVFCPPDGLLLIGWRLLKPGAIRRVRVRCGAAAVSLSFEDCLPVDRQDVVATGLGAAIGADDGRCGFIAYAPRCVTPGEAVYLEVEAMDGRFGFKAVRLSDLSGMGAIRRLLGDADVRFDELDGAFDRVLGPAVASLNAQRLAGGAAPDIIEFGDVPGQARCSIIVPLYGRMDFLEYQMALFSEHPACDQFEFIYVLDDPPRRRELENLAQSVYARFEVPFRLVLLPRNLGFAPANNHGLRTARGEYICFLNSDAFPGTVDWIERLLADLESDPDIGVIGPRLLFDDGSIQHEGCIYRPLKEFGGWMFVDHDNRGRRPGPDRGLRAVPAITGACMLMRRDLAEKVGGFDEAFVIGDFEDSDLCKRIIDLGYSCAVDRDVTVYHLERQSQAGSRERWRQNLTLYNAWVHQRRWYPEPAA